MTEDLKMLTDQRNALESQRQALDEQIATKKREAKAHALECIKDDIAEFGFTPADLFDASALKPAVKRAKLASVKPAKPAVVYRDPASGKTWGGKGKHPFWLRDKLAAGAALESFKIAA